MSGKQSGNEKLENQKEENKENNIIDLSDGKKIIFQNRNIRNRENAKKLLIEVVEKTNYSLKVAEKYTNEKFEVLNVEKSIRRNFKRYLEEIKNLDEETYFEALDIYNEIKIQVQDKKFDSNNITVKNYVEKVNNFLSEKNKNGGEKETVKNSKQEAKEILNQAIKKADKDIEIYKKLTLKEFETIDFGNETLVNFKKSMETIAILDFSIYMQSTEKYTEYVKKFHKIKENKKSMIKKIKGRIRKSAEKVLEPDFEHVEKLKTFERIKCLIPKLEELSPNFKIYKLIKEENEILEKELNKYIYSLPKNSENLILTVDFIETIQRVKKLLKSLELDNVENITEEISEDENIIQLSNYRNQIKQKAKNTKDLEIY